MQCKAYSRDMDQDQRTSSSGLESRDSSFVMRRLSTRVR